MVVLKLDYFPAPFSIKSANLLHEFDNLQFFLALSATMLTPLALQIMFRSAIVSLYQNVVNSAFFYS